MVRCRGPSGVRTVSTSDQYPCSLPSLLRWCWRRNIRGDGVRRKAALQVGWSALHRIFNRSHLKTKHFQKKKRTQCQNHSVGDELRLGQFVVVQLPRQISILAAGKVLSLVLVLRSVSVSSPPL